ncbi:AMP-binding protein [Paraburkholderia xenovorans]|uniref:AMP-binding protein n=1 Tax=Paraburkholderia xenovorans TaxID=36873 RepID=UPI0015590D50|nr:AMP-binding protein [Paraburkholderia xenovorans]NPT38506.1 AMP-binding protein [Paraburkholderia xenovorans]
MISLDAALAWHATSNPTRAAICYEGESISYAELLARVELLGAFLTSKGVKRGDRIALLMKNSPAFVELAFAVSLIGAVFLPLNYRLSPDEVGYILDHAGVSIVFVDEELAPSYHFGIPFEVLNKAAQADSRRLSGSSDRAAITRHRAEPEDMFRLMYTSGTTDRPKGVIHTYANFFWKTIGQAIVLGLSSSNRLLVCGPLYHVGAFDLPGIGILLFGGCVYLHRDFNAVAVLDSIAQHRIDAIWMAPAMVGRVLEQPLDGRDLTSLRYCVGGGERTPEARITQFARVFPHARYVDSYGLTETCSGDTFMPPGYELEKLGSVGTPTPNVTISIRDESGAPLPVGCEGEICIAGPKVTSGYWRDPERTQASFFGNSLRTGDIGRLDAQGFLWLTDRRKDMIISGGENVASSEIERVIFLLPQIEDVAVVGIPDDRWGERPVATVVVRDGMALSFDMLVAHCAAHLARFKIPVAMFTRSELPRNASGKILKRKIREEILSAN